MANVLSKILEEMTVDSNRTLSFAHLIYAKLFVAETTYIMDTYKAKDMVIGLKKARAEANNYILRIMKLLISIDDTFTNAELYFYQKSSGQEIDGDELYEITNGGGEPRFIQHIFSEIAHSSYEVQLYTLMFSMAFCAYTDNLSEASANLLNSLVSFVAGI